jgi:hypothetical protein
MKIINFIYPMAHEPHHYTRSWKMWLFISSGMLVLSLTLMLILYLGARQELSLLQSNEYLWIERKKVLTSLEKEIVTAKTKRDFLKETHRTFTVTQEVLERERSFLVQLLSHIETTKATLATLTLDYMNFDLSVTAPDVSAITHLYEAMLANAHVSNPTITSIQVQDDKVAATIKGSLREVKNA